MLELDIDELILKAAAYAMDHPYRHETGCLVVALQAQMPEGVNILKRLRQQVKEYKKLQNKE